MIYRDTMILIDKNDSCVYSCIINSKSLMTDLKKFVKINFF